MSDVIMTCGHCGARLGAEDLGLNQCHECGRDLGQDDKGDARELEERDASGLLTPWALAMDALADRGCDCGTDDDPGTCLACRCEVALEDERERAARAEAELAKARVTLLEVSGAYNRWANADTPACCRGVDPPIHRCRPRPAVEGHKRGDKMIKESELDKMEACRHLLPPPGDEVVGELLAEVKRLRTALHDAAHDARWCPTCEARLAGIQDWLKRQREEE